MNLKKFVTQKGLSLAEALVAVVVSTIVMGATYTIYNNFQGTFVRQINHNNMKQEARFALNVLQYDSKMAGYKHPDSTLGEVQEPVKVLNDDADETEVADDTEYGEKVLFCFDTQENDGTIRRKLIKYELQIPYSPETEKTILKKKVWNSSDCTEGSDVDIDWSPVAQFFSKFAVRIRSKHIDYEINLKKIGLPKNFTEFNRIKSIGFSDKKLSELTNLSEDVVRKKRIALKILPVYKKVDTCAAEFKSFTPYMYSTYQRNFSIVSECEAEPTSKKKIIILGGGPNRIGQGIEFDYCCCQASFSLKDAGFETIMVNCNPETVSTDYDTSDRLYFEPLKEEFVFNIIKKEQMNGNLIGIIAQFGGQTPIKLAKFLHQNKLPILGTQYSSIDLAEDRDRFRNLLNKLKLKQAESGIAKTYKEAIKIADKIGLPLMVRPSYVLGGRAMEIVYEKGQLRNFIEEAFKAAEKNPILIDKFIDHAMEVDVDAISDGKEVYVAGIMQHIEEAGIHSGDSACSLPPISIKPFLVKEIENQTKKLALALKVKGFMNIQFAIKKDEIYVIEVNPRASRTVPFVSKAKGLPLAKIASRVMAGEKLLKFNLREKSKGMYAVKEAVFPFNKFPNSDLLLGPEMKSTGEVMGFDKNFGMAFAKSQIAAANSLPKNGLAFISLKNSHKDEGIGLAKDLIKLNFKLSATKGTAEYIRKHGMKCKIINKVSSGTPHIVDILDSKRIALVINTGGGNSEHRINDAIALRRATLKNKVPYCTNMSTAQACLEAIKSLKTKKLDIIALQELK